MERIEQERSLLENLERKEFTEGSNFRLTRFELRETRRQGKIYAMDQNASKKCFDYRRSEIHPSYVKTIINPFLEQVIKLKIRPLILDLGSGKGDIGTYLKEHDIDTIEIDLSRLGFLSDNKKKRVQATAWRLPFGENTFEGIHCKDMLTHITPKFRKNLFLELKRVLKPKGLVVLCFAEQEGTKYPYQYGTHKDTILNLTRECDFSLLSEKTWLPDLGYRDWYTTVVYKERQVLILVK